MNTYNTSILSNKDYHSLTVRLFNKQNFKCYTCGHRLNISKDDTLIGFIIPLSKGGIDKEDNFALNHKKCNPYLQFYDKT